MLLYTIQPQSFDIDHGFCFNSYQEWKLTSLSSALLQQCYPNSTLKAKEVKTNWNIAHVRDTQDFEFDSEIPLRDFIINAENKEELISKNGLLIMYLTPDTLNYDKYVKIALEQNPKSILYVPKTYLTKDFVTKFVTIPNMEEFENQINLLYVYPEWAESKFKFHRSQVYSYIFENIECDDDFYNFIYNSIDHPTEEDIKRAYDPEIYKYLSFVNFFRIENEVKNK